MKKMRNIGRISLLVSIFLFCINPVASAQTSLFLDVNQSQYLNAGGSITRVAVANPEIADIKVISPEEMLLIAKKAGTTSLYIWTDTGMRQEFSLSVQDADSQTAAVITRLIACPQVGVEKLGDKVLLHGIVANQLEKNRAEKIAELYGSKVVNLLEMTNPSQIRLEAKIVEISTDRLKKLGIEYVNASKIDTTSGIVTLSTATGVLGFGQTFTNSKDSSPNSKIGYADINATLQALITHGEAKLLSQPSVVTMSGEKANILIGGEIPVPISNSDGQLSVEWHEYGIKLNIEPTVNEDENITSKVSAEVSTLDPSSAAAVNLSSGLPIPALHSRKAETMVNMSSGSTMVIGGLIDSEEGRQLTKFPFLGDLPIIGQFFRSTSTTKSKKELVILVTPTLVDENTPAKMSADMKQMVDNAAEEQQKNEAGNKK